MVDMVTMDIMAREKLRQSLLLSLVTTIMDILIMEVMVTMDIMARGKLRQLLLLSLVTTIMDTAIMAMVDMVIMERERLRLSPVITIMDILIMEAMVIMDIMARGKQRQSQDTITMDMVIMVMEDMAMVIMVNQATIYLFQNFSKLKRVPLNLVKRNTHLLKNSKFTLCNKRLNII